MRYAKQISTGMVIESQSGGNPDNPLHLSSMTENAVSAGYDETDVEVGYAEDAVVSGWLKEQDEASKTYADRRTSEYPKIGDQLDMIYHAGLGGDEFQAAIKSVKDAYPKP
jgi:hypothetical protein